MTTEAGQNWTMHLADCRDVAPVGDIVVTDPPYGYGAYASDQDGGRVVERLRTWRPSSGAISIFGYPEELVAWCVDLAWGRPDEWIVWWPTNAAAKAGGRHKGVPRQTEHIAVYGPTPGAASLLTPRGTSGVRIGQSGAGQKKMAEDRDPLSDVRMPDVWRDASPGVAFLYANRLHPNEKPVDLLLKLVTLVSEPGQTIADPYTGSGTTGVAALRLGRRFVGCEIDPEHFKTACERLRAEEAGSTLKAQRAGQTALFSPSAPMPSPEGEKR